MIRTQIYLPKDLYQLIQLKAAQANKPTAQVIREWLKRQADQDTDRPTIGEALLGLAAIGERYGGRGPADLSERIDDYLYGDAA